MLNDVAIQVVKTLQKAGFEACFAGGCVRDRLLKRPAKDFDVATNALPDQVEKLFPRTVSVGKSFGVIRVLHDGHDIEVATFRTDGKYLDGRHPTQVQFTSAEIDAQRRDFTINGLFYDPLSRKTHDFVGGLQDLKRKVIRCIGNPDERFTEDKLRILRCVRFAAQLGFKIDPKTWRAVRRHASEINQVSAERIRDEMNKLLTAKFALKGLELLDQSGLLKIILPEIDAMKGVKQPKEFHPEGDVFVHTLKVFSHLHQPGIHLAWAALLHDVGKPPTYERSRVRGILRIRFPEHARVGAMMAAEILTRLRFSNDDKEAICSMVDQHMTFKDVQNMRLSTLKRFMARPTFDEEVKLHKADCLGCHGKLTNVSFLKRKKKELSKEEIAPPKLLTGKDLIEAGLEPGPVFGKILKALEEAQLEGEIKSREQAKEHLKSLIRVMQKSSHQ